MPAPTRATVALASALLLTVPLVSACGAGRSAGTAHARAAIDGAQADAGDVQLRNVTLETPSGEAWAAGSQVALSMYVVNRGTVSDTLTSVRAVGGSAAVLAPSPLTIAAGGVLLTGAAHTSGTAAGTTASTVTLTASTVTLTASTALRPAQTLTLEFTFARAGVVTLDVPVATH